MTEEVRFTERELDIMSALWRRGSGTVSEVQSELGADLGYTSVLRMLQVLEEKGHVRPEREGRANRYFPTVSPEQAGRAALRRLMDTIFHGSPLTALTRLAGIRRASPNELRRMQGLLEQLVREAEEGGESGVTAPRRTSTWCWPTSASTSEPAIRRSSSRRHWPSSWLRGTWPSDCSSDGSAPRLSSIATDGW